MKYISKIFQPLIITPKNAQIKHQDITSKSQRLMMELGVVRPTGSHGMFAFLPMGIRSLNKLVTIVDNALVKVGAQKISLPILVPENLWKKSGRLESAEPELMKMRDRHDKRYILGPTHEEAITDLISSISPISSKNLPLRLYQIGSKFRDEMRPRYGVIRAREFIMKDLYTFDIDEASSKKTYDLINEAYDQIFATIGVKFIKVEGATGNIGGSISHEYHFPAFVGDDSLLECNNCSYRMSHNLLENFNEKKEKAEKNEFVCPKCEKKSFKNTMGIEVGHTFLLGTKYSSPLQACSVAQQPLHMGCYGLGLTRILGAAVEMFSSDVEMRWPNSLAPYTVCIVGPKAGSKEEPVVGHLVEEIYSKIIKRCQSLKNDVIIDDRTNMTIGKRAMEAKRFGFPFVIVIGQKACQETPEFELLELNGGNTYILDQEALLQKVMYLTETLEHTDYMENYSIHSDALDKNILK